MANPDEDRLKKITRGVPKKPVLPAVKPPVPAVKKPGAVVKPQVVKSPVKLPASPIKKPGMVVKPQVVKPRAATPKPALSSLNPEALKAKPGLPVISKPVVNIPAPQPQYLADYTVKDDDTLGGIALKYYGSAKKEYWMFIYEANKAVIGERPNVLRPGIVLHIPEKPNL
jgi:nucleoid-associated protein YgaU